MRVSFRIATMPVNWDDEAITEWESDINPMTLESIKTFKEGARVFRYIVSRESHLWETKTDHQGLYVLIEMFYGQRLVKRWRKKYDRKR